MKLEGVLQLNPFIDLGSILKPFARRQSSYLRSGVVPAGGETGAAADVQLCSEVAESHIDHGLPSGQRVDICIVTYVKLFVGFSPREDVYSDH